MIWYLYVLQSGYCNKFSYHPHHSSYNFFLWWEISRSTLCYCSVAQSFSALQPPGLQHCRASLSFTISWILLRLMSIESVIPCIHLILSHPLLLPSIFPSIKVFPNESSLHIRRLKYWSFSFSISINPSNEYSRLTSFRVDWFDHPAVQGTLKSLLQHYSLKASILHAQPCLWEWSNSHIHTWLLEKP